MKDLIILLISCLQKNYQENERSDNFGDFFFTKKIILNEGSDAFGDFFLAKASLEKYLKKKCKSECSQ